jgi:hypothetical protein
MIDAQSKTPLLTASHIGGIMGSCRLRFLLGIGLLSLAACGGGGSGGGGLGTPAGPVLQYPPTEPAALSPAPVDIAEAVKAVVSNAAAVVSQEVVLPKQFLPFEDPFGEAPSAAVRELPTATTREHPLALVTFGCAQVMPSPCAGTLTVDSNFDASAATVDAGSHVTYGFNGLSGTVDGVTFELDGAQRIDFLTTFDQSSGDLAAMRFKVTSVSLRATIGDATVAPDDSVLLVAFDAQARPEVTINGRTFSGLAGLVRTDSTNFEIGAGRVRAAHWTDGDGYVDHQYDSWRVAGGRPLVGSIATVSGSGGIATVTVTASSASSVTYHVVLGGNGFNVVAAYAGGVPAYTATAE